MYVGKVIDNCFNLLQIDDDVDDELSLTLAEKLANFVWQTTNFIETELYLCIR